jgi:hypothetical protein
MLVQLELIPLTDYTYTWYKDSISLLTKLVQLFDVNTEGDYSVEGHIIRMKEQEL